MEGIDCDNVVRGVAKSLVSILQERVKDATREDLGKLSYKRLSFTRLSFIYPIWENTKS